MPTLATTRMSSKGQVVIPEGIRSELGLRAGVQFVVIAARDAVVLRQITAPSMAEFDAIVSTARAAARRTGMKKSDVRAAIAKVRKRRAAGHKSR